MKDWKSSILKEAQKMLQRKQVKEDGNKRYTAVLLCFVCGDELVSAGIWLKRMNSVDGYETRYWVFLEHVLDSSASNQLWSAYVHAILCICRMSSDFKLVWDIMMLARKE